MLASRAQESYMLERESEIEEVGKRKVDERNEL